MDDLGVPHGLEASIIGEQDNYIPNELMLFVVVYGDKWW